MCRPNCVCGSLVSCFCRRISFIDFCFAFRFEKMVRLVAIVWPLSMCLVLEINEWMNGCFRKLFLSLVMIFQLVVVEVCEETNDWNFVPFFKLLRPDSKMTGSKSFIVCTQQARLRKNKQCGRMHLVGKYRDPGLRLVYWNPKRDMLLGCLPTMVLYPVLCFSFFLGVDIKACCCWEGRWVWFVASKKLWWTINKTNEVKRIFTLVSCSMHVMTLGW